MHSNNFLGSMDKEEFVNKLGKRIKEIRTSKGLSLYELGLRGAFDKQALSKIENGRKEITTYSLLKICRSLEITLEEFFMGFEGGESQYIKRFLGVWD